MATTTKFENGLFIFRRDLRIVDNRGLIMAESKCKNVYGCFIFTPEQVGTANPYKSNNAVQFMIESLENLNSHMNGKLMTFYGKNKKILTELIHALNLDYICFNRDYTPYAIERDEEIMELCKQKKIVCEMSPDYYLYEPGTIFSGSGSPYQKFTPYYQTCLSQRNKSIHDISNKKVHFHKSNHSFRGEISLKNAMSKFTKFNQEILVHGGRENAQHFLEIAKKTQRHFEDTHNNLDKQTSLLSSYIKFGCISIREVYKAFKGNHGLIRQLMWRDFFMNILYAFPRVLGKAMKPNYDKIRWHKNEKWFRAWKTGTTGFPVIDAGMRELNHTGYMHNRARLFTSSFLIKTLLLDWRDGEEYFATKLTDYDPASNNGNWQAQAGTGSDSQPYFRIYNPWEQSKKHDSDAIYIKKWVPELANVPAKVIHQWDEYCEDPEYKNVKYPKPIVDYREQRDLALNMYMAAFK